MSIRLDMWPAPSSDWAQRNEGEPLRGADRRSGSACEPESSRPTRHPQAPALEVWGQSRARTLFPGVESMPPAAKLVLALDSSAHRPFTARMTAGAPTRSPSPLGTRSAAPGLATRQRRINSCASFASILGFAIASRNGPENPAHISLGNYTFGERTRL